MLIQRVLTELFMTQYAGLRAIGTDVIKEEDRERYEKIRKMVEEVRNRNEKNTILDVMFTLKVRNQNSRRDDLV